MNTFPSINTVGDIDNATMFQTEFLNSLNLSGLPEHKLKLKIDTVVILLLNMDIYAGHWNGTRNLVKVIGQYRMILHKLGARDDDKKEGFDPSSDTMSLWREKLPIVAHLTSVSFEDHFFTENQHIPGTICREMCHCAP